ncbi:FHA domain-containing protein [Tolypothrix tenuis PCC 7101]|uniref:FHA domain-containing protein n=1 Tax=Tolypothrix tenuis PCC 7101 TaxID=231146 RepID=A0A1Z4N3J2_9CYAN|nr:FHA domain-containing protein [Aulosira sp. FACHB-113]BAZ00288.1 FHA domain-containing protein [Tolypothrix tenuis PCC 7101]BAZ75791.1 FHA domain-containing protein [Aulosira laxa NIES-50]
MPANRCPNPNCEYFNRALPNNAKVCPWCSTPLANLITPTPSRPTAPPPPPPPPPPLPVQPVVNPPNYQPPVNHPKDDQQRVNPPVPAVQPVYTPPPPRSPIIKLIHTTGREFQWSGEVGFIGRRSQSMTLPPEIDLTGLPHEGIISRRHARIYWDWQQNTYMIVDMSTNGIYLNNKLLNPGMQYSLHNEDSLQFGQDNLVRFTVYIMF